MAQGSKRSGRANLAPCTIHHASRRAIWLRAALIAAAIAFVYANSLSGPFILDDADTVVANATIHDWTDVARVVAQPRNTPLAGRPLVAVTFALNYAAGGLAVQGYHLTNIAIHTLCALLLFGVVRRTLMAAQLKLRPTTDAAQLKLRPTAENVAFAVALVWAIHPLTTEAVNYLTQRTESLMALCLLASLYAAIRSLADGRKVLWQIAAVTACGLGMLCKETMVVAPILVVLYDRIFVFDALRGAIAARWRLYGGLALTWLVLVAMMLPGPRSNTAGFGVTITPWTYLLNQAVMIARYLRLAVWPHGLVVHYGPPLSHRVSDVWPQAALVVALIAATLMALRWQLAVGFLGAWVFITLAPTSSFVPIATEMGAERRMYLPLMAIAALLMIPAMFALRRRASATTGAIISSVVAVALGTATLSRNRDYATELSLAESTLAHWPTDVAHGMVGNALLQLQRPDDALKELRLAARTVPRARYNLGVAFYNLKRLDEAIAEFEGFAVENPMDELVPSARRSLGDGFVVQHKWPEAVKEYQLALAMIPHDADTRRKMLAAMQNQGLELAAAGRFDEAVTIFRRVVDLDPADQRARRNLAAALLDHQDAAAAEIEARTAIEANPLDAASYDLLGRALAIQGKYEDAVRQFRDALKLAPEDAGIRDDMERVKTRK